ncbi:hypothetical protein FGO68_gene14843 [Halteria grandinella]|uniref:Uncharacterized protein n=1 Tax=Halteria grandinella TaxID=5974 RepID=A0A8J8NNB0_HALGN|nr:hypothetical protein FGO68_gene14843 [Halteria grandinella]
MKSSTQLRGMSHIYMRMPSRQQLTMPSFILKVVDFPSPGIQGVQQVQAKLGPLYQHKHPNIIQQELDHVTTDKNLHVTILMNTRENVRRTKSISRFKQLILMGENYKSIVRQDSRKFYIFYLSSGFWLSTDAQLQLQGIAALKMVDGLTDPEFAETTLSNQLKKQLTTDKLSHLNTLYPINILQNLPSYKKIAQQSFQHAQFIYHPGLYPLLHFAPFSGNSNILQQQTRHILGQLRDKFSDLAIIIENKYDMHAKALRLIKKLCIHYGWSWEHKRLLDMAIYTNSSVDTLIVFYEGYLKYCQNAEVQEQKQIVGQKKVIVKQCDQWEEDDSIEAQLAREAVSRMYFNNTLS